MDMAIDLRGFHLPAGFLPRRQFERSGGGAQAESEKVFYSEKPPCFSEWRAGEVNGDLWRGASLMRGVAARVGGRGNVRSGGKSTVERAAVRGRKILRKSLRRKLTCARAK